MSVSRTILAAVLLAALLVPLRPPPASAQTCLGVPADRERVAFVGGRSTRGVSTSYGGDFHANLGGALLLGAGFSIDTFNDLSENGFTSRLSAALPRRVGRLSACPGMTFEFSEVTPRSEDGAIHGPLRNVRFAPGIGLGIDLPLAPNVTASLHARPAVHFLSGTHARIRGGRGEDRPATGIQGSLTVGGMLRLDQVFFGARLLTNAPSTAEPALVLQFGLVR